MPKRISSVDADPLRIAQMEDELERIRNTVNQLAHIVNMVNMFLPEFRDKFGDLYMSRWFRFFLWLRPINVPFYKKQSFVMRMEKSPRMMADRMPMPIDLDNIDDETA